jgi:hypothetical protein
MRDAVAGPPNLELFVQIYPQTRHPQAARQRPLRISSILVVIGADDSLTPPAMEKSTADAIPGARLVMIRPPCRGRPDPREQESLRRK